MLSTSELQEIVLNELADQQPHFIQQIVLRVLEFHDEVYESQIVAMIWDLIRQNRINRTGDCKVQLFRHKFVAAHAG